MKKVFFFSILSSTILFFACQPKLETRFYNPQEAVNEDLETPESYSKETGKIYTANAKNNKENLCCKKSENYIPDTNYLEFMPERHLRVNFHFMNSSDSSQNHQGKKAVRYVKDILKHAEKYYRNNKRMLLHPYGKETSVLPTLYHFVLTSNSEVPNDDGIYFHYDDELFFYVNKGKNRNNYNKAVIQKYGIGLDSVMNIFLMPPPPDSVVSKTYSAYTAGIALRNAIKITSTFVQGSNAINVSKTLNHEAGHNFGLSHAWTRNDGCNDTPQHPNCWSRHSTRKGVDCDTIMSNNIMDYNATQCAWTPCQIGRIHSHFARKKGRNRKFAVPLWCEFNESRSITIQDSIVWKGEMDVNGNLTIKSGASLEAMCRVSIAKKAKIIIEPGGILILNKATLHNDCDEKWEGIEIQKKGKVEGKVVLIGDAKIENAKIGNTESTNR